MSSESEGDEFYDAEEATPGRQSSKSGSSTPGKSLSLKRNEETRLAEQRALEEEERQLQEDIRQAEIRRRQEAENLHNKMLELAEKKKKMEREKNELERKAEENARRRRRLEEQRQKIEAEGTPKRGPPKPPRSNANTMKKEHIRSDSGDAQAEPEDSAGAAASANEALSMETLNLADKLNVKMAELVEPDVTRSSKSSTLSSVASSTDNNSHGVEEEVLNQVGKSSEKEERAGQSSDIGMNIVVTNVDEAEIDVNVNSESNELEKRSSKEMHSILVNETKITADELVDPKLLADLVAKGLEAVNDCIVDDTSSLGSQEPDIIKDTKSHKMPPPRPPPPKAPPRRKKADGDEAETSSIHGLPLDTPMSKRASRNLEQSLDLDAATSGTRVVTAAENPFSKAEMTAEEVAEEAAVKAASNPSTPASSPPSTLNRDSPVALAASGGMPEGSTSVKRSLSLSSNHSGSFKMEDILPKSAVRPRTASGSRFLTDEAENNEEILEKVNVLNLDTGEALNLHEAEDKLPQCVNPLSLHIMRRTKEYSSTLPNDSSLHSKNEQSDEDESKETVADKTINAVKPVKKKARRLKKIFGKTAHKIKAKAGEVIHKDNNSSDEESDSLSSRQTIRIKASGHHKGPYDFDLLVPVQDLYDKHKGAIWTMKFSHCGKLLATGGQDNLLRVWVLRQYHDYFDDMRKKYSEATKVSPTPSQDSLNSQTSDASHSAEAVEEEDEHAPFLSRPFAIYRGHSADVLDLSWSKNYFVLTSSMDKTVRLWHLSRKECLCCFQHIDFVTAIAFHPKDDRYFLSGSLDGKLRLWNIPDKKVALWNEVVGQNKMITAANFCLNGRFAVAGTYDGRCIFYSTDQMKYYTQIHVRSTRGKNARGRKVTGIETMPGKDKILVTSNDSRIRLYDLRDLTLTSKFKGCLNNSSQIKANFSSNGKYIVCGSEDHFVYIWKTQHDFYKFTSARRDRSDFWEGIKAHQAVVTVATFATKPNLIIHPNFKHLDSDNKDETPEIRGEVLLSADFNGAIRVFINKFKPGSG